MAEKTSGASHDVCEAETDSSKRTTAVLEPEQNVPVKRSPPPPPLKMGTETPSDTPLIFKKQEVPKLTPRSSLLSESIRSSPMKLPRRQVIATTWEQDPSQLMDDALLDLPPTGSTPESPTQDRFKPSKLTRATHAALQNLPSTANVTQVIQAVLNEIQIMRGNVEAINPLSYRLWLHDEIDLDIDPHTSVAEFICANGGSRFEIRSFDSDEALVLIEATKFQDTLSLEFWEAADGEAALSRLLESQEAERVMATVEACMDKAAVDAPAFQPFGELQVSHSYFGNAPPPGPTDSPKRAVREKSAEGPCVIQ